MPFGGASDRAARPECRHLQPAGASFYAEGEWIEADEAYGEAATALQVNDLQVALRRPALDLIIACWLNQAQCQLQLRAWAKAEKLCDGVLQREPRHAKALYRRGRCCLEIDDWPAAKKAFAAVLDVDATNKDARRGLLKVREAVKRQKALDRARFGGKTVAKGFSEARPAPAAPEDVAKPPEPTPANRRSAATAGLVIAGMFVAVAAIGWYGLLG